MRLKHLLYFIAFLFVTASCDTIDGPYFENPDGQLKSDVIIIEFTGMKCTFCPVGHQEIETLHELYGDRIHAIAIHASSFAEPSSEFPEDYRCKEGNEIYKTMMPQGFPTGTINSFNTDDLNPPSYWAVPVDDYGQKDPAILVYLEQSYQDSVLSAEVRLDFVEALDETHNLCMFVTENGVIGKQLDAGTVHEDYEHNHMLRGSMNGTWGTAVDTGTEFEKTFTIKINKNWNPENLKVVPFVYNTKTKEILTSKITKTE